jgi:hypothetical protein
MAILSKADILAVGPVIKTVNVEEWGGEVRLRALTARGRMELWDYRAANIADHQAYEKDQLLDENKRENLAPVELLDDAFLQLIFSIVGEDNERLFSADDIDLFNDLPYATLNFLFTEVMALQTRSNPATLKKTSD